jgi:hypothetical protein
MGALTLIYLKKTQSGQARESEICVPSAPHLVSFIAAFDFSVVSRVFQLQVVAPRPLESRACRLRGEPRIDAPLNLIRHPSRTKATIRVYHQT